MAFPIGPNIQAYGDSIDWGKTLQYWSDIQPSVAVVTLNNLNDAGRIFEAQQRLKGTLVIARYIISVNQNNQTIELDGGLHTEPKAENDPNYYLVSPENTLNLLKPLARDGAVLYWANEPSGEEDALTIARLVEHTVEGIQLADEQGLSLCLLNWGVGHPLLAKNNSELDPRLDDILLAINEAKGKHYWGLHMYAPADTLLRLVALEGSCTRLGIPLPRTIITEFGFDTHNGSRESGYKSREMSGLQLADYTIEVVKNKYRRYVENGTLMGLAAFCEGGDPRWASFNFGNDPGYKDRIKEAAKNGELSFTINKRTTGNIPKYFPGVQPVSAAFGHTYKVGLPSNLPSRNLRALHTEASEKIGEVHDGDIILLFDSPSEYDNLMRKWQYAKVVEGRDKEKHGWIYVQGGLQLIATLPPGTPRETVEVDAANPPPEPEVTETPVVPASKPMPEPAPSPAPTTVEKEPVVLLPPLPATANTPLTSDQWVKLSALMHKTYSAHAAFHTAYGELLAFIDSIVPVKPEGVPDVPHVS